MPPYSEVETSMRVCVYMSNVCTYVHVCGVVCAYSQPVVDADLTRQRMGDPVDEGLWLGLEFAALGTGHLHLCHLTRSILISRKHHGITTHCQFTPLCSLPTFVTFCTLIVYPACRSPTGCSGARRL